MADLIHPPVYANWETRGYWEGAARGELVLQRCGQCATVQHKPRGVCATCLSGDIEHFVASGRGIVYTFTVTHQNQAPPFAAACPYVMAYVRTAEGPAILTHIVGCEPDDVHIGMDVVADFQVQDRDDGESFATVRFRPA